MWTYTKNAVHALSVPLTVEVLQDGETVYTYALADNAVTGAGAASFDFDLTEAVDPAKPVEVRVTANVFDRTVVLAEIK